MNRPRKWVAAYSLALALLASATCAWLHDLLPLGWLCVLLGPMMLIALGWDAGSYTPFFRWGLVLLLASLLLALPLAWRPGPFRLILAAVGVGVWFWAGSLAMSLMAA